MARVFVSHARKDLVLAREWHQWLIEAGHKVFLAHDLRDGITVGEEWEQRLRRELRLTDAVVCAITPAYLASRVCTDEVMLAQFWGRPLFPVQAEPDVVHPRLTNLQHIGLAGARHQLIDALRRIDDAALPDDRPLAGPAGVPNRRRTGGAASVQQFTSYDEPVPCGRHSDAAQLLTWLDPMEPGGPTTIAVTGLPGVGKTTLARYACSKAMDRFRGGAVYLNMNGYDPDPQARTAAEEVYGPLLLALGVDSWYGISDSDAGHAGAVYHRKLAEWSEQGRSVLLMLDNVSGFKQVDGLLSDHRAHRVMITSRNADFPTELRRVQELQLEILDVDDAVTVLRNVVHERRPDDQRLSRESDKAERLAEFCGRLPQALELVGGLLAEYPGMSWMDELIRRIEASPLTVLGPVQTAFRLYWKYLNERDDQVARLLLLLLSVNSDPKITYRRPRSMTGPR